MKRPKTGAVLLPLVAVLLLWQGAALAHVRLFIGPWLPVPVIVEPFAPPPFVPPPPQPPALPPVGYVDTDVRPKDATVTVDGDYRGIADTFDGVPGYLNLLPGRHLIEFTRDGYVPVRLTVTVQPGEVVSVDLDLKELRGRGPGEERSYQLETEGTGFVLLAVQPQDAAVYIDDAFYGPASQFGDSGHKIMLRAGTHTVEIGRPGYVLYRGTITVVATQTTRLEVTLQK
jgi:hypothetical protein